MRQTDRRKEKWQENSEDGKEKVKTRFDEERGEQRR